ncbi:MAG: UDP-N-acetylmuramoyl-L-alanyl-D-glutamate--2,6-diaminopimelate ligase [Gammaproteobacteria bacterium RIFCSPHIGHO2_12_FULL_42_10]|nr:MAG: UDP-N-acetylmuramoyl-L-alanyl-D-glutamate--2,6-diaminopimelate ligase [Gammaproteobacteria bacterium RIFCSPHIGHO2_12_FULL_42_10]
MVHLALDSRHVAQGGLFLAIQGTICDGRQYIEEAIHAGACAVLVETSVADAPISLVDGVPVIPIRLLREKMGRLASRFYDEPSKKLRVIGVTGTSGKTSCTHFMAQVLDRPCGVIGTLGIGLLHALNANIGTTPDAISLQAILQQFVEAQIEYAAMEVTSHSIHQKRIQGIHFAMRVFTNLTQDHLDYHGNMAQYAATKQAFLVDDSDGSDLIINADDHYGNLWIKEWHRRPRLFAYGMKETVALRDSLPAIHAEIVKHSLYEIQVKLTTPWGDDKLSVPLSGFFNLSNALATLAVGCLSGMPLQAVLTRLSTLQPVVGRMQTVSLPNAPLVVVDYAHKPDALLNVLSVLRAETTGRLVCIFGCGGERDRLKRPVMAQIAERYADDIIVTNDNPRHEAPQSIAAEIMQGFKQPLRVRLILDRASAIFEGIRNAKQHDCVLIAGRGGETEQKIGDSIIHFDDAAEAMKCLSMCYHSED